MKYFLTILLLLLALACPAATFQNYFTTNSGSIALMSYGPAKQMAAIMVTNNIEDRSRIYVTGNGSALVNGRYNVAWYDADNFVGVWTNTASTNKIVMNNASNNVSIANQPFVISGNPISSDQFMFQTDQGFIGVRNSWVNPFEAGGMVAFAGTATLTWGTNQSWGIDLAPYPVGQNQAGLVATNVLVVSQNGDDGLASRLNGYYYQTLFRAVEDALYGDLILIEPGYHLTYPFHMTQRGVHILGSGEGTIVEVMNSDDVGSDHFFQSRALVPWDNCSIGNFILTNGLIAIAQTAGPQVGGTNIWVHDLTIYPPTQITFPEYGAGSGDQQQYFNVGVRLTRIGDRLRFERLKIYSSLLGFGFHTTMGAGLSATIADCEVYCDPTRANNSNIWTNNAFVGAGKTNVGGMIGIGFDGLSPATLTYTFTLNLQGGKYISLNGGTNVGAYVGGETQTNRNSPLWVSRANTNTLTINMSGVPQFRHGTSNGVSYAFLNEATNSNVVIAGYYNPKFISQLTNYPISFNTNQVVHATGAGATSTASMATMNFGTTDPTMTVAATGYYMILAGANGFTSSADSGEAVFVQVAVNNVAVANTLVSYDPIDAGLVGMVLPWALRMPVAYQTLTAGETIALQWQSGAGNNWRANYADLSIVRLR